MNPGAIKDALSEIDSVLRSSIAVLLRFFSSRIPCTIYLASGDGISSLEADRLREACQSLIGHLGDGQGDQVQGPDISQVNLRGVIGACTRIYRLNSFLRGNKIRIVLFAFYNCTGLKGGLTNFTD